jgi:hypothetical protein
MSLSFFMGGKMVQCVAEAGGERASRRAGSAIGLWSYGKLPEAFRSGGSYSYSFSYSYSASAGRDHDDQRQNKNKNTNKSKNETLRAARTPAAKSPPRNGFG